MDLGAGMGRAVLLASEFGFKAGGGSGAASDAGGDCAEKCGAVAGGGTGAGPIRIVEGDAVEFALPAGAGAGISVQSVWGGGDAAVAEGLAQRLCRAGGSIGPFCM